MFSQIFPLAPAITLVGFILKLRGDITSLSTIYKRIPAEAASGIGTWNDILVVNLSPKIHISFDLDAELPINTSQCCIAI